jgi:aspartyl-tRNA synthetase
VLNRSEPLPFQLDEDVREDTRLKYRYLDLRRDVMQQRLRLRHRVTRAMREYLDHHGFIDLETPMLTKATPEVRATISCRAARSPASSLRCRSRRRSSSSC